MIVGGPPFVQLRELHRSQCTQIWDYRKRLRTARRGQFDLYMLFIERALELLTEGGYVGFSVANTFIRTIGGDRIRRLISQRSRVIEIIEFEDKDVYPETVTQIALLSLAKGSPPTRSRHVLIKGTGGLRTKLSRVLTAVIVIRFPILSFMKCHCTRSTGRIGICFRTRTQHGWRKSALMVAHWNILSPKFIKGSTPARMTFF